MLWAPTAAFACGGSNPSAVNVYVECVQNGGGSKPSQHTSSGATHATTPVTTTAPTKTDRALAHVSGPDKALLSSLAGGGEPAMKSGDAGTAPSAIGSAFDLGSGPTALLVILAGTAIVLLGGSGLRFWRRRHHQV
jgi:sarcosine oxidase gamma subunit